MKKESIEAMRARLTQDDQVQAMIRMRAFEIYQSRKGQSGNPQHDWLQAEHEVLSYLIQEEAVVGALQGRGSDMAARPDGAGQSQAPIVLEEAGSEAAASETGAALEAPRKKARSKTASPAKVRVKSQVEGEPAKKKTSRTKKTDNSKGNSKKPKA